MSDSDKICHNCKWHNAELHRGTCHRNPPQVVTVQIGGTHTAWPTVHTTDWCGEWARAQSGKKS